MPTYEYECKSCGHAFEVFQSMRDDPLRTCPQCGRDVRRLINGGGGVIFKGSGFYVTDKKNGTAANSAGGTKSETKPSGGGDASGTAAAQPAAAKSDAPKSVPAPAAEKKAAG